MISSPRLSSGFLSRLLLFVVVAAVFLAYKPSLNNDFVNWDDDVHLLENRFIRSLDWKKFKEIFSTTVNHTYIPLTTLSFAVEYNRFGLDPFPYHFDNLLLHLLVTALVMVLARRLGLSVAASGLAALIFGIHPQHVESVAWVTERKDVLSGVFFLLTLAAYVRYVRQPRSAARYVTVAVLFTLGLLSKSMLVTLPFVLLLLDYWPLARCGQRTSPPCPPWALVREKIPLLDRKSVV